MFFNYSKSEFTYTYDQINVTSTTNIHNSIVDNKMLLATTIVYISLDKEGKDQNLKVVTRYILVCRCV